MPIFPLLLTLLLPARADSALFLGNSFTFVNALDQTTLALLAEGRGDWADGTAERLAEAGLTFEDHVENVATAGSAWAAALGAEGPTWTWVILQEQSQIPGFPASEAMFQASVVAAGLLDGDAAARGAETVFLMTWGYREGDATNPEIFADYPAMQAALATGYEAYRDATSAEGRPTWLAPAGLAWARAYDEAVAAGADPLATDSRFFQLYQDDGHHPSPLGTYLTACVIYATLTGASPEGLSPSAALDAEDALWAQQTAAATVFDESLGYTYPWTGEDTGTDTGGETGEDSGATSEDTADTGDADTGAPKSALKGDCACSGGAPAGGLGGLLAMGGALLVRRRRTAAAAHQ